MSTANVIAVLALVVSLGVAVPTLIYARAQARAARTRQQLDENQLRKESNLRGNLMAKLLQRSSDDANQQEVRDIARSLRRIATALEVQAGITRHPEPSQPSSFTDAREIQGHDRRT
jgi:hypothetical protein